MYRPQPSRRGARASQARVLRLLPADSERSGALACAAKAGCSSEATAGTSEHGLASRKRGLSPGAVPFHRARPDRSQRSTVWARRKRACCACFPQRVYAVARLCAPRKPAGRWRPRMARQEHGLTPRKRGFTPVQCLYMGHVPTTSRAARRTRVASARAAPAPHGQPTQWKACVRHANGGRSLKAVASTFKHGRAPREKGVTPVQCSFLGHGLSTTSTPRRARFASERAAPPPHKQPTQWRACVRRQSRLLIGGHGWHVGA